MNSNDFKPWKLLEHFMWAYCTFDKYMRNCNSWTSTYHRLASISSENSTAFTTWI